jgi:hypothetical protein
VPRSRRTSRVLGGLACVAVLGAAGCSQGNDTRAAYCDAWSTVETAFDDFRNVDVVAVGIDGVRASLDGLRGAVENLGEASRDQLGDEVSAFSTSLQDLVTTLTSPDLPVDRREQVRAARGEVDTAWNALLDEARADCG